MVVYIGIGRPNIETCTHVNNPHQTVVRCPQLHILPQEGTFHPIYSSSNSNSSRCPMALYHRTTHYSANNLTEQTNHPGLHLHNITIG